VGGTPLSASDELPSPTSAVRGHANLAAWSVDLLRVVALVSPSIFLNGVSRFVENRRSTVPVIGVKLGRFSFGRRTYGTGIFDAPADDRDGRATFSANRDSGSQCYPRTDRQEIEFPVNLRLLNDVVMTPTDNGDQNSLTIHDQHEQWDASPSHRNAATHR
jgi:hypothetical protein